MSIYWWLSASLLIVAFYYAMLFSTKYVQRVTGREGRPEKPSNLYDGTFFLLALRIRLPPIHLLPNADSLVGSGFMMFGILVGSLTAQAMFGRKLP